MLLGVIETKSRTKQVCSLLKFMRKIMLNTIFTDPSVKRDFKKALSKDAQKKYNSGALGEYDDRTLIYDVFLQQDNQTVVVITPPPLNLSPELLPMFLVVDGKRKAFSLALKDRKFTVYKLKLDAMVGSNIVCELSVPQGDYKIELELRDSKVEGLALVTLQKNNNLSWIEDWIDFYREQYDVNHVFIYDNNSDNYAELSDALRGKATMIPWNFPYGPFYQHDNSFCQLGALNHFKYKYGDHCTILNFDIDELLFCRDQNVKNEILSRYYTRINSYQGSSLLASTPSEYSFKHFLYREKKSRNCAYKYIVKGDSAYLRVHAVKFFKNRYFFLHKMESLFRFIGNILSNKKLKHIKSDVFPIEKAYFIHYTPITTSWKESEREKIGVLDSDKYQLDALASKVFGDEYI